jgi:Na+/proline symporter
MFNAVLKIPMQFFILLLGVFVFVFFQFERPPLFFNEATWNYAAQHGAGGELRRLDEKFAAAHAKKREQVSAWIEARHAGDPLAETNARAGAIAALAESNAVRQEAKLVLKAGDPRADTNDADYIFMTFVLRYLPHGAIGLLVAVMFAAAMASKASELNALGSTTTVDVYRHLMKREASDDHYVAASKWFTAFWGLVALTFALSAHLVENLIQAVNILGSIFYGPVLGLFAVAFFFRRVGGTAVFWGVLAAQLTVFAMYFTLSISYLWYNLIGCAACVGFSVVIQSLLPKS